MVVLVDKDYNFIQEGDKIWDEEFDRVGIYTGWMPPHSRNEEGLIYVRFPEKTWDDCFLPSTLNCKLLDI